MLASPARSGAVRARIGLESRSCVNDTIDYSYKLLEFKIMFFKFEQLELISNVFEFDWKKFDDASSKTTDGRTSDGRTDVGRTDGRRTDG